MIHPDNLGYVIIETATTSDDIMPTRLIEKRKDGRVLAEGCLQEASMKNRNGRYYDKLDLAREIDAPRQKELLRTGNMRGEDGHPLDKDLARQQTIIPDRCAVVYTKFWMDGDFVMGNYFGTYNSHGEEFDKELRNGMSPSFSLRALGTIQNTSRGAEVKNLKMITYDRVIYPSHDKAYTHKVLSEAAGTDGNNLVLDKNDQGIVFPITNESVIDYIKKESMNIQRIEENFDLLYDEIKMVKNGTVQLTDRYGGIFVVNLEQHIHNEIMHECMKYTY